MRLAETRRWAKEDSRLAQELAKWAETKGRLKEYQNAIYKAYFSDGLNISDKSILSVIAELCGLSKMEALEIMETGVFSEAVDMDWKKSKELGIMVAPTYVLNGTKLMGSQSYEKLEELMAANKISKKSET